MSTIDKTGVGPTLGVKPVGATGRVYVIKNTIDLTDGVITQADVYQCLAIPAKTKVVETCYRSLTAAVGTTLTMDIGDGSATNGWDASVDGKSAAGIESFAANGTDARAVATGNGYYYDTADSIDIVMTTATAITAGPKFELFALCVDYS
jgi:hypothetical protein